MAGRSREWLTVDDAPSNVAERQYHQRLIKDIEEALAEIEDAGDKTEKDISVISRDVFMLSGDDVTTKNSKRKRKQTNILFQSGDN